MSNSTEIAEVSEDLHPFDQLMHYAQTSAFAEQVNLARRMLATYEKSPPEDPTELVFAQLTPMLLEFGLANHASVTKQLALAAEHFERCETLVSGLPEELWDDPSLYLLLKQIHLNARMSGPVLEASANLMLGSLEGANLAIVKARSRAKELVEVLSPGASEQEKLLRPDAGTLFSSYVSVAGEVNLRNASLGRNLNVAQSFFEDVKKQIAGFEVISFDGVEQLGSMMEALSLTSQASSHRLDAEIALQNEKYDDALVSYDRALASYHSAAESLPMIEGAGQLSALFAELTTMLVNQPNTLAPQIRMVGLLKKAQDDLKLLSEQNADRAKQFDKLQEFHRQAMSDFAKRELPITVNASVSVENQIKNEMNLRQAMVMSAQDGALDEVLKLLRKLEPSDEVVALEDKARRAKSEPDMTTKIEKAAKVVEAASKIVEEAAKIVPYGPPVMAVLKGLYSGWVSISGAQPDR